MQRVNIGEFEELVLLVVAILNGEAYGVAVMNEIDAQTSRKVNISAVHAALRRLEEKGFVESGWSAASAERGGRRKRIFDITDSGRDTLEQVRALRNKLWDQIPGISLK
ncbi:MAG: helix-turn-helix transcriptional regulator [Bacteroidota bacterium]